MNPPSPSKRGVILDVDGTLIDTNPTHLEAWLHAFGKHGYTVAPQRLWAALGMGGDQLVPAVIGDEGARKDGKALRAAHGKKFLELAGSRRFAVFPGVEELFRALRLRRIPVAIATSSNDQHLAAAEQASGLPIRSIADELVTKSEAPASKPEPDLIETAVERLSLPAEACLMIGDTEHDGEAAVQARVTFVAVTCGGNPRDLLAQAHAVRVLENPLELTARLEELLALR